MSLQMNLFRKFHHYLNKGNINDDHHIASAESIKYFLYLGAESPCDCPCEILVFEIVYVVSTRSGTKRIYPRAWGCAFEGFLWSRPTATLEEVNLRMIDNKLLNKL